ncbi:hypothetical protein [Cellulomonas sp. SG140]|uniref:hypothetical protein n=1 Tax=Cellulomonas sp. SG140 TaxID=2976536 RepID=UPI0021E6EDE2|nr:hypothetical protein [Cellulomonas sp. SG140]
MTSGYRFPSLGRSANTAMALFNYCTRIGYTLLNDQQKALLKAGNAPLSAAPAEQVIYDLLWQIVAPKAHRLQIDFTKNRSVHEMRREMRPAEIRATVRDAAARIHDSWNPDYAPDQRARAVKGAEAFLYRHPGSRPWQRAADLDDLHEVAHLSKRDQAMVLGCSTATIARLRRDAIKVDSYLVAHIDPDTRRIALWDDTPLSAEPSDTALLGIDRASAEPSDTSFDALLEQMDEMLDTLPPVIARPRDTGSDDLLAEAFAQIDALAWVA